MAKMSVKTKRVRVPKDNYKFAHGTTKRPPKAWEEMMGIDFIKYVEKKARRK